MYHSHHLRSNRVDVAYATVGGIGVGDGDEDGDEDGDWGGSIRGLHTPSAACMAWPWAGRPCARGRGSGDTRPGDEGRWPQVRSMVENYVSRVGTAGSILLVVLGHCCLSILHIG